MRPVRMTYFCLKNAVRDRGSLFSKEAPENCPFPQKDPRQSYADIKNGSK